MKKLLILIASLSAVSFSGVSAFAADSCSNWLAQGGGVEWRQCVRDNGSRYCQQRSGGQISNVRC
ncbi:MAG: hypothetical protein Q8M24_01955 [Pseudolabrys sp.]|nr:hypothetical protein [Pseudolabrys sp.]MDP2294212.1 hypothetical protein [Pseudolabrys sp.]